jgi:catechol 2,3-dioxygenase-like lactoylglutathione lyase family enzyme
MAEVESLNHTAVFVPNIREAEEFWEQGLGAHLHNRISLNTDDIRRGRGLPHTCWTLADYLMVFFVPEKDERQPGANNGFSHGFAVSRERFGQILDLLRERGVEFDGPITHPEAGPLGESIYLSDTGGNRLELCWRRDEDRPYSQVMMASA